MDRSLQDGLGKGLIHLRQDVRIERRHGYAGMAQLLLDEPDVVGLGHEQGGIGVPGAVDGITFRQHRFPNGLFETDLEGRGGVVPTCPSGKQGGIEIDGFPPFALRFDVILQVLHELLIDVDVSFLAPFPALDDQVVLFAVEAQIFNFQGCDLTDSESAVQRQVNQHVASDPRTSINLCIHDCFPFAYPEQGLLLFYRKELVSCDGITVHIIVPFPRTNQYLKL